MIATLNPITDNNVSKKTCICPTLFNTPPTNTAPINDRQDEIILEALSRAAAIRETWSAQEIADRKQIGQKRRDQLTQMLLGGSR